MLFTAPGPWLVDMVAAVVDMHRWLGAFSGVADLNAIMLSVARLSREELTLSPLR